jgi:hypothetical protein
MGLPDVLWLGRNRPTPLKVCVQAAGAWGALCTQNTEISAWVCGLGGGYSQRAVTSLSDCWGCLFSSRLHSRNVGQADEASPRTLVKPLHLVCRDGKATLQLCVLPLLQNQGRGTLLHLLTFHPWLETEKETQMAVTAVSTEPWPPPCLLRRWELCRTPELLSPPLHVLSQILSGALNADSKTHSKPGCTEAPAESTSASSWCLCGCWRQKQVTSPWAVVSGWLLKCLLFLQPVSSTQEPSLATPCWVPSQPSEPEAPPKPDLTERVCRENTEGEMDILSGPWGYMACEGPWGGRTFSCYTN